MTKRIIVIDKGSIVYDGSLEKIVKRYAKYKIIKIDFDEQPDVKKLSEIGEIKEINEFHAKIYVPREESIKRAIHLLEHFVINDFVVEELPIEDIVRHMFDNQSPV